MPASIHDHPGAVRACYRPGARHASSGQTGRAWRDVAHGDTAWVFERDLADGEPYDALAATAAELEFGDQVDVPVVPVRS